MDDQLLSLEAAASALGVSHNRLMNWLENNEWMVIGDTSYDVVWCQVEAGNLAARNGGVRVTPKGISVIRRDIGHTSNPTIDSGTDILF